MSDTRPLMPPSPHTAHPAAETHAYAAPEQQRDEFTLRIPKPGSGGPARAAVRTTEFWMTIAMVLLLLIATAADPDGLPAASAWRFATYAVMAYVVSRGLAKLGNRPDASHDEHDHARRPAERHVDLR